MTPVEQRLDQLKHLYDATRRYLQEKVFARDWHGVADAANDLREIDAEVEGIQAARSEALRQRLAEVAEQQAKQAANDVMRQQAVKVLRQNGWGPKRKKRTRRNKGPR